MIGRFNIAFCKSNCLSLLFLQIFALISVNAYSRSVTLEAQARGGIIEVGEKFQIVVSVSDDLDGTPPKNPRFKGAKMLYPEPVGPIHIKSRTTINGRTTSFEGTQWTYTLRAEEKGKFSFGPIEINGVKSNVLHYTIGDKAPDPYSGGSFWGNTPQAEGDDDDTAKGPKFVGKGSENLFLVARVSKTNVYEQEALQYTVTLYTTYDGIRFLGATESPKFEGFTLEEAKERISGLHTEVYQGKAYSAAVIAKYIIFPQMKGDLKIIGNKYTITVESRYNYYDPFFGRMSVGHPKQLSVQPNDLTVKVKPLPQPQPADFSGGVGRFRIVSVKPRGDWTSNQAASVVYKIIGSGNIKYITMPDLNNIYPPEIEVYSPTSNIDAEVVGSSVNGVAQFDYSVMPLDPGNYNIPSVGITFFNPESGKYETTKADGFNITVLKGKQSINSQKKDKAVFSSHLMIVKNNLSKTHSYFISKIWYALCYILPILILAIAIYIRRRQIEAYSNITAFRSKKAGRLASAKLKKAAIAMKKNNTTQFYDEILSALWGFASDRLKMPGSQLNRDNINESLATSGVSNQVSNEFISIIDDCEYAKYAPSQHSDSMEKIYNRAFKIINQLNKAVVK